MCLIAIAYREHPDYPLILAANRDEFYTRPTAPLDFWPDHPGILAGRDLQGRGTWLGVARNGRIAAVTNYREPQFKSGAGRSRGFLVSDFLAENISPETYLQQVAEQRSEYNGFNLVVGDPGALWWYSNRNGGFEKLAPGIHAISNHLLNSSWPKVEQIKTALHELISRTDRIEPEAAFDALLTDTAPAPDEQLPDTGVGLTWERILSPRFVISDIYGTRSSSVILVDRENTMVFWERTFENTRNRPVPTGTREYALQLPLS